jgi:hypothetical protein
MSRKTNQTNVPALDFFIRVAEESMAALEAGDTVTVAVVKNGTLDVLEEEDVSMTVVPAENGREVAVKITTLNPN